MKLALSILFGALLAQKSNHNGVHAFSSPPSVRYTASMTRSSPLFAAATIDNDTTLSDEALIELVQQEAELAVDQILDETCEVEMETGLAVDPECQDEELRQGFRTRLKGIVKHTLNLVRSGESSEELLQEEEVALSGDLLEQGWERRGAASALRRNAEVWKFALKNVFKILKARKLAKKEGVSDEEASEALTQAAIFLRDGLLELGPTFGEYLLVVVGVDW